LVDQSLFPQLNLTALTRKQPQPLTQLTSNSMIFSPGISYESLSTAFEQDRGYFEQVAGSVPYERRGIPFSEILMCYQGARLAGAWRIIESGRTRGQSALMLSRLFPELSIVSIEFDQKSPDVEVAKARLAGCTNMELCVGDATRLVPPLLRDADVVLIDGPKGLRGLRSALGCLASGKCPVVFVHDMAQGTPERMFADRYSPEALYSDDTRFASYSHKLDDRCSEAIPPERRFDPQRSEGYGFSLACIPWSPRRNYHLLKFRTALFGFSRRLI
jgi:hypothetical protein